MIKPFSRFILILFFIATLSIVHYTSLILFIFSENNHTIAIHINLFFYSVLSSFILSVLFFLSFSYFFLSSNSPNIESTQLIIFRLSAFFSFLIFVFIIVLFSYCNVSKIEFSNCGYELYGFIFNYNDNNWILNIIFILFFISPIGFLFWTLITILNFIYIRLEKRRKKSRLLK
jgi:hypothetical protein